MIIRSVLEAVSFVRAKVSDDGFRAKQFVRALVMPLKQLASSKVGARKLGNALQSIALLLTLVTSQPMIRLRIVETLQGE